MCETTQYDAALSRMYGDLYDKPSGAAWLLSALEEYAVSALPADRYIRVLDLACGVGSYCWRVHRLGHEVVGVDVSPTQIKACIARAYPLPPRLSFYQRDAKGLVQDRRFHSSFDLVNASWLYDTANDENELFALAHAAKQCLKPGGKHVGMEINFNVRASAPGELDQFGLALMSDKPAGSRPINGERITAHVKAPVTAGSNGYVESLFTTRVTFFEEQTYTRVFSEAGFREIEFHPPAEWNFRPPLSQEHQQRFRKYVQTNPEMIAFSALA